MGQWIVKVLIFPHSFIIWQPSLADPFIHSSIVAKSGLPDSLGLLKTLIGKEDFFVLMERIRDLSTEVWTEEEMLAKSSEHCFSLDSSIWKEEDLNKYNIALSTSIKINVYMISIKLQKNLHFHCYLDCLSCGDK